MMDIRKVSSVKRHGGEELYDLVRIPGWPTELQDLAAN
jgi:hypothetical protein